MMASTENILSIELDLTSAHLNDEPATEPDQEPSQTGVSQEPEPKTKSLFIAQRRETLRGNELTIDAIYMQQFKILNKNNKEKFRNRLEIYSEQLLNNPKLGLVFYKVHAFSNQNVKVTDSIVAGDNDPTLQYILHFHTFAMDYLTQEKVKQIEEEYLPDLLKDKDGGQIADLIETKLMIHEETDIRKPVYNNPEETDSGYPTQKPGNESSSCFNKFINYWLIVPRVQYDFFNLLYQMYTFDITHQGFIPKFVHFFTIPINIILFMMLFAQFAFPGLDTTVRRGAFFFPTNFSYIPLAILILVYILMGILRKCLTWGFATAIVITLLWGIGNLFYEEVKLDQADVNATGIYRYVPFVNPVYLPYNPIMWSYIVSVIQASSHFFVPQLPPYITGVYHWEAVSQFLCCKGKSRNKSQQCLYVFLSIFCFPVLSVSVAYFSWPHLIGTQVFYIMAGIGYEHDYFKKYKLVVEKAELSGNPRCAQFPMSADTLMQPENPYRSHLERHGIIHTKDEGNKKQIVKDIASAHIYQAYFHGRHMAKSDNHRDSHLYHYRALNDHYYTLS